ncbi:hypothetical protein SERLADRAFT_345145 [Serpula lacrymans var. lacrymans S7.9]|uniref:Uncharacterized protein n=1 Tax=Serpula lacrymans var. lacrymans (strain S7.9) TaxID=578457 RepID=F8NFC4_SERL9|nr:uncharacterized protein SERLADRAFT_345145 [Serpula lacrymans var. lacrymans S7.9]EGO31207.1 hypothetical protein SERLADRAFT_345145 [Serpula lacrymans var. lacrymans S7.9]
MNPQLTRARILALGSFVANFSCQLYGMLTTPNMKQVADENHYAYSPNPFFIAAFFAMQTVLQLLWIKNLFVVSSAGPSPKYEHSITLPGGISNVDPDTLAPPPNSDEPEPSQMAYVPIYALGNICIAAWMVFWISQKFWVSQAFVTVNTLVQLYAVFYLLGPSSPFALSGVNFLTHIVAKTFAGIGVLDFLDNGAVAMVCLVALYFSLSNAFILAYRVTRVLRPRLFRSSL